MRLTHERRGSPRAVLAAQAVLFMDSKRVRAEGVDISQTGIGVVVPHRLDAGAYLRLNFALKDGQGVERWFDADGLVARATKRGTGCLLGIQFTVIEGHVVTRIHEYVRRRHTTSELNRELAEAAREKPTREVDTTRRLRANTHRYINALKHAIDTGNVAALADLPGFPVAPTPFTTRSTPRMPAEADTVQLRRDGPPPEPDFDRKTTRKIPVASPATPSSTPAPAPAASSSSSSGTRPLAPVAGGAPDEDTAARKKRKKITDTELEQLFQDALREVDAPPPSGRRKAS